MRRKREREGISEGQINDGFEIFAAVNIKRMPIPNTLCM
jgi:hypothetical protein